MKRWNVRSPRCVFVSAVNTTTIEHFHSYEVDEKRQKNKRPIIFIRLFWPTQRAGCLSRLSHYTANGCKNKFFPKQKSVWTCSDFFFVFFFPSVWFTVIVDLKGELIFRYVYPATVCSAQTPAAVRYKSYWRHFLLIFCMKFNLKLRKKKQNSQNISLSAK